MILDIYVFLCYGLVRFCPFFYEWTESLEKIHEIFFVKWQTYFFFFKFLPLLGKNKGKNKKFCLAILCVCTKKNGDIFILFVRLVPCLPYLMFWFLRLTLYFLQEYGRSIFLIPNSKYIFFCVILARFLICLTFYIFTLPGDDIVVVRE